MHLAIKPIFQATSPVRATAWECAGENYVGFGDDKDTAFSINVESRSYAIELAAAINAVADLQEAPPAPRLTDDKLAFLRAGPPMAAAPAGSGPEAA
ncbi:hypothetical protein [Hansschlegelia sp.]|uniref:hypothetical protein n=1 Tax=Hansschlegelia sp. TaxID=2041892 RepID=UPI002C50F67C|nr:hypothetical protein [Hansschlegelia sp.]HVI27492.1 hypothetical protein [Hansschlegelia sp.]